MPRQDVQTPLAEPTLRFFQSLVSHMARIDRTYTEAHTRKVLGAGLGASLPL